MTLLLDELIAKPSSLKFYGINGTLASKMTTIRLAAHHTALKGSDQ